MDAMGVLALVLVGVSAVGSTLNLRARLREERQNCASRFHRLVRMTFVIDYAFRWVAILLVAAVISGVAVGSGSWLNALASALIGLSIYVFVATSSVRAMLRSGNGERSAEEVIQMACERSRVARRIVLLACAAMGALLLVAYVLVPVAGAWLDARPLVQGLISSVFLAALGVSVALFVASAVVRRAVSCE